MGSTPTAPTTPKFGLIPERVYAALPKEDKIFLRELQQRRLDNHKHVLKRNFMDGELVALRLAQDGNWKR